MRWIDRESTLLANRAIDPITGCWLWTGRVNNKGYGYIAASDLAHRAAARLWLGHSGQGWVLHHCDVRRCFNPDHLYVGNGRDNVRDGTARNRMLVGEKNGHAKLTWPKVREIRAALRRGEGRNTLARRFAVSPATIHYIRIGHTWREHVLVGEPSPPLPVDIKRIKQHQLATGR